MNILVVHPSLNAGGGSERLCLTIVETLKENGFDVALGTFEKTDWRKIESFFNSTVKPDKEYVQPRRFGTSAYGELLNFHLLFSYLPLDYDVVIISTSSPWFYCPTARKVTIYFNCSPVNYTRGIKRAYLGPYNVLQKRLLRRAKEKIILTNSTFSSRAIKNVFSLKPKVLYPPVDVKCFFRLPKQNVVLSVGRFDPFKRYEILIKAFCKVNNGKCIIIGSTYGKISLRYLNKLKRLINNLRLNHKVKLIVNCPFNTVKYFLSKAKVYVHCAPFEYFGISVVEAMASGCVPVVCKSGGPYTDVVDHGKYGLCFSTTNELANIINRLLCNHKLCEQFSYTAMKRALIFDKEKFKREFLKVLDL